MSKKLHPKKPPANQPFRLFWYYLKEDEGPIGWILNIIVAFIVIKYILLPGIGFVLGTSFPLVAVVSGSMEHNTADFDGWWTQQCTNAGKTIQQFQLYQEEGITKEKFKQFKHVNGLNTGDLMLLQAPKDIQVGDTIVFNGNTKFDPIIHRVVNIEEHSEQKFYKTKGDNNCGSSDFEQSIPEFRVLGKTWVRVPALGYVKLYFEKALTWLGLEKAIAWFR